LVVPEVTLNELKIAAVEADSSVRSMILKALEDAGYTVPAGDIVDRRQETST
jgi:hypothetical protein